MSTEVKVYATEKKKAFLYTITIMTYIKYLQSGSFLASIVFAIGGFALVSHVKAEESKHYYYNNYKD